MIDCYNSEVSVQSAVMMLLVLKLRSFLLKPGHNLFYCTVSLELLS